MMSMSKKKMLAKAICCTLVSAGFVTSAYAATPTPQAEPELPRYNLAEIIVGGQRYIAGGYVRATSKVGILGEQDTMKSPLSVTTISEKAVGDFITPTEGLAGLLSLVPSVQYAGNPAVDQVNIRGFYESGYGYNVNGIPGMSAMARHSMNWIDSVDVIEGPSTGVTGTTNNTTVGGTININSKVATEEPVNKVGLSWYSKSAFEETVDVGRRMGKDNRYGIRISAANVSGERGIDNWKLKQQDVHINLDQRTETSKTNLMLGYINTDSQGRPVYTKLGGDTTKVPEAPDGNVNLNPEWRQDKYKQFVLTLNHEQKLGEHINAFLNAGHYKKDWYYCLENNGGTTLIKDDGTYKTSFEVCPIIGKNEYLQIGLRGDFKSGELKHDYVLGVDRQWNYSGSNWKDFGGEFSGNIYQPDAGSWIKPAGQPDLSAPYTAKTKMTGWSVMDTMTTTNGKLSVLLGVHGHNSQKDSYNKKDGIHASNNGGESEAICPTYGLNYAFSPRVAAFASHSEQFVAGAFVKGSEYVNAGTMLDPARTKQNEVGVKFKTGDFFHKLSYFDIQKPTAVDVPLGYNQDQKKELYLRAYDGETEHKGVEYTAMGALTDKWNLIGGLMYLDAVRSKTDGGKNDGKQPNGVPEWTANAGVEYKADANFSALFRANYVGASYVKDEKFKVPGYFRFDLGVKYKTQLQDTPVLLRAMCYNVTNTNYWQPQGNNLYIGSPRTFMLSAEFEL